MDKKRRKIRKQKRKSKGVRGKKAMYPLLEKKLLEEFSERRSQGKIVKKWWFTLLAKKLLI